MPVFIYKRLSPSLRDGGERLKQLYPPPNKIITGKKADKIYLSARFVGFFPKKDAVEFYLYDQVTGSDLRFEIGESDYMIIDLAEEIVQIHPNATVILELEE